MKKGTALRELGARYILNDMRRSANEENRSALPRVGTITLQDGNKWKTLLLVALLLAVGLYFLGRGVNQALTRQGGWTEIQARSGSPGCAGEFQFQYLLDDRNGNAEYRALSTLYTEACERAARVYAAGERDPELGNLGALNAAPNEALRLEPELYRALEKLRDSGDRTIYLAPLYAQYSCLFFCEREEETLVCDPLRNPELAAEFRELAGFANDPAQIDLELLGDDTVRLKVSEAYLAYARENGIQVFLDFGWMKNAFILDDLAEAVLAQGFHRGCLQSVDGFGRNLCEDGESFSLNVFDRPYTGDAVVAQLRYARPIRFLSLHSYTPHPTRNDLYYELSDGQVRSIFVDAADGMPKTALDDLLVWSDTRSCGELVLAANRVFTADRLDRALLEGESWYYAYCLDRTLFCNDPAVSFASLAEEYRLAQTER